MSSAETKTGQGSLVQVGRGARLEGRLRGRGAVLVNGRLSGELDLEGELLVAAGGEVDARGARAASLRIDGSARGRLRIEGSASLGRAARLAGTLEARELEAAPGAELEGELLVDAAEDES